MSESEVEDGSTLTLWWVLALAVLVAATAGVAWLFRLTTETVATEAFAALCDACAGVLFVGGGLSLHRRSIAKRQRDEAVVRALVRVAGNAENALMLMRAHRSVPTWTKQVQALVEVKNELQTLEDEMQHNGRTAPAKRIHKAIRAIEGIMGEYEDRYPVLAPVQDAFENLHRGRDPRDKAAALPAHWHHVLGELPQLSDALAEQESRVLEPLREAIRLMQGRPARPTVDPIEKEGR